jgi:drug/metabolite transporter (DMT)-like permease
MSDAPKPMRHDIRRGALLMLGATALFTVMAVFAKQASEAIPFVELMFFRSALALPVVAALVFRGNAWRALRTKRFSGHVLRACSGTAAMACGFYALSVLPLAEQVALSYTSPLFVTMLAIPFLGEKVGIHRWSAVLLGFVGIVVMALGQGAFATGAASVLLIGTIAAVSNGLFSAITTLLVRGLSATETSTTIVLWQSVLMTLIIGMALPFVWVMPTLSQWLLLLGMGLFGGVAQVMMTEANASAQVSSLGPYSYGAIIWSMLLGWMVWGDVPGVSTLAGAGLIVLAGLYILHREWQRRIR